MGIVYHANYLKWFEIGRTELFRNLGIVYSELELSGYFLPLTKSYCHYLSPAKYDDIIILETAIANFKRASIKFEYTLWNETRETKLVTGCTLHAFTNAESKIVRAPAKLIHALGNVS